MEKHTDTPEKSIDVTAFGRIHISPVDLTDNGVSLVDYVAERFGIDKKDYGSSKDIIGRFCLSIENLEEPLHDNKVYEGGQF